jgi:tRNA(Ile)-lysidine synthase
MKARLQQRIRETLARHRMVHAGDTLGVGVSGGADSVALLLLLDELKSELGIRLVVLHFNHQLRGPEADTDEQFVAELARQRGLAFLSGREDVAARAREHGWNLEDAARRLRYEFFSAAVDSGRATRIAVAHTADDQAETLLAHLLRGTGLTGLAGIYPVAGHVVRPLLDVRRGELREYLAALQQLWREDRTNLDTARLRARIRHVLLPQVESEFQPAAVAHLGQLAALAREDEAFWDALLADRYAALVERSPDGHSIRIADLLAPLPLGAAGNAGPAPVYAALTKRLIRRLVEEVKGDRRQLTAQHVEQVVHLATACASGHRVQLPSGVLVERSFDRLIFSLLVAPRAGAGAVETKSAAAPYQYVVDLAGRSATVSVPEIGRRFRLKVIDWPPTASDTIRQVEALDADRLRSPLVLRSWRPGDSYRPLGRRRVRKLKRLLLENRVAARERTVWPVLTSAGALAWARGLPVAEEFAPQAGTKMGLVIAEESL